ncbi:MAG: hypothetical protein GY953_39330 [bacterium]|nr:hypothetical protein [bacterium]
MTTQIDDWFKTEYGKDVKMVFQQLKAKLRHTVRSRENVKGDKAVFHVAGKGSASTKARHGQVPVMNADRDPVTATLTDHYAGDWVDKLDEARVAPDERRVIAETGAAAIGRKQDELIITELDTNSTNVSGTATGGMTEAKVMEAMRTLGANDAFEPGKMYAVIGYEQYTDMLSGITAFASSDFVSDQPWLKGFEAKNWLGTVWIPHSGLTKSGGIRDCHWYHKDALGTAMGDSIKADITWHGDRAAHFVNHAMSMAAKTIDGTGMFKLRATEL